MSDPYYVTDLKSGYVWANNKVSVTLTYTFWDSTPSYYSSYDAETQNFQTFTAGMKDAVRDILAMVSSICNINFQEVAPTNAAQLGYGQALLDVGVAAWAYYPGTQWGGDVWTNNRYADSRDVDPGDFGFATLIHETGHALGLKHSFEGANHLSGAEDTSRYTVMSYTDVFQAESFMLYDVAALQSLYGANMDYATGDDVYALRSGHAYCIWDAGGDDTLDASALGAGVTLKLTAGTFSSVGLTENISIAYGVTIENANGGSGADKIYGNAVANHINGNGGNDIIYGSAGNDFLDGGFGTDSVVYAGLHTLFSFDVLDSVTLTATSSAYGTDTLTDFEKFVFDDGTFTFAQLEAIAAAGGGGGSSGGGSFTGAELADKLTGTDGDDVIYGMAGNDTLTGMGGNDFLDGGFGSDRMYGGAGDDIYFVDSKGDKITELRDEGTDTVHSAYSLTLKSNLENLVLDTGAQNGTGNNLDNHIIGNSADNKLKGSGGNDILEGGGGHDMLTGGSGADVFKFSAATAFDGPTVITDFNIKQGDSIDISDLLTGYDPLADALTDFVDMRTVGKTTELWVDADGAGSGSDFVHVATINKVTTLSDEAADVANHLLIVSSS